MYITINFKGSVKDQSFCDVSNYWFSDGMLFIYLNEYSQYMFPVKNIIRINVEKKRD